MFSRRREIAPLVGATLGTQDAPAHSTLRNDLLQMSYSEAARALAPGGQLDTTMAEVSGGHSEGAAAQMARIVAYAEANHSGSSAGRCFEYVWRYIYSSGYGKIRNYGDCPEMGSAEARQFAEYMNVGSNAAKWGLQRLGGSTP